MIVRGNNAPFLFFGHHGIWRGELGFARLGLSGPVTLVHDVSYYLGRADFVEFIQAAKKHLVHGE
jgi:hypothetical protein